LLAIGEKALLFFVEWPVETSSLRVLSLLYTDSQWRDVHMCDTIALQNTNPSCSLFYEVLVIRASSPFIRS